MDKLCIHLPHSLVDECTELVKGYSKELIELLLADLTPQEVCVYIKLCDPTEHLGPRSEFITDKDGEICMYIILNIIIAYIFYIYIFYKLKKYAIYKILRYFLKIYLLF